MSRIAVACSLVLSLTTGIASAQSFARPPVAPIEAVDVADEPRPQPTRAELRAKLAERRATNLAHFHRYVSGGVFPANTFVDGEANVWRDAAGKYCAAATIIRVSGNVALVDKVAEQNNFIKLGQVRQGPLMDWMLTSGLTQEEIALIQRPFRRITNDDLEIAPQIDLAKHTAETARLAALYRDIEKKLAADTGKSLDLAVERLVKSPDNMWRVMGN